MIQRRDENINLFAILNKQGSEYEQFSNRKLQGGSEVEEITKIGRDEGRQSTWLGGGETVAE